MFHLFLVWFFLVASVSALSIKPSRLKDGKHIWMWFDGPSGNFHDMAAKSWTKLNPCYDFHWLNESSVETFLPWKEILNKSTINFTKSSQLEVLKVLVLSKYGGVWVDSSVFCWTPLDEWLPGAESKGYFAFTDSKNYRQLSTVFMAGKINSAPMAKLENYTREYIFRDRATPLSPCCDDNAGDWATKLGMPSEIAGPNISGKKLLDELETKGKYPDHVLNYLFNQVLLDGDDELNRQWQNQTMEGWCFYSLDDNCTISGLPHTPSGNEWFVRKPEEIAIDHLTMRIAKYNAEIKNSKDKCGKV